MWLLFALLSALMAALVAIFGKIGLQNVDSTTATMVRAGVMFLFLFFAVLFLKKLPGITEIHGRAFTFIILSGVAGALSWIFYFVALKLGPVHRIVAIDRLSLVFAILLAALFLSEKITWKIGVGALAMTVGAILIAF